MTHPVNPDCFYRRDISTTERMVLLFLSHSEEVLLPVAEIVSATGYAERTVQYALRSLARKGMLEATEESGPYARRYTVIL